MDALIQRFAMTGQFSEDRPSVRDRIRYTVHAKRILLRATLLAAPTALVEIPLGETWVATSIRIHNTNTTTDRVVTFRDVPNGESSSLDWQWANLTIKANETLYLYNIEEVWDGGYTIYGWADVAGEVTVKVQGTPLVDA